MKKLSKEQRDVLKGFTSIVPKNIKFDSQAQKEVFALIYYYSQKNEGNQFTCGYKNLEEETGYHRHTISKYIGQLKAKGYIDQIIGHSGYNSTYICLINTDGSLVDKEIEKCPKKQIDNQGVTSDLSTMNSMANCPTDLSTNYNYKHNYNYKQTIIPNNIELLKTKNTINTINKPYTVERFIQGEKNLNQKLNDMNNDMNDEKNNSLETVHLESRHLNPIDSKLKIEIINSIKAEIVQDIESFKNEVNEKINHISDKLTQTNIRLDNAAKYFKKLEALLRTSNERVVNENKNFNSIQTIQSNEGIEKRNLPTIEESKDMNQTNLKTNKDMEQKIQTITREQAFDALNTIWCRLDDKGLSIERKVYYAKKLEQLLTFGLLTEKQIEASKKKLEYFNRFVKEFDAQDAIENKIKNLQSQYQNCLKALTEDNFEYINANGQALIASIKELRQLKSEKKLSANAQASISTIIAQGNSIVQEIADFFVLRDSNALGGTIAQTTRESLSNRRKMAKNEEFEQMMAMRKSINDKINELIEGLDDIDTVIPMRIVRDLAYKGFAEIEGFDQKKHAGLTVEAIGRFICAVDYHNANLNNPESAPTTVENSKIENQDKTIINQPKDEPNEDLKTENANTGSLSASNEPSGIIVQPTVESPSERKEMPLNQTSEAKEDSASDVKVQFPTTQDQGRASMGESPTNEKAANKWPKWEGQTLNPTFQELADKKAQGKLQETKPWDKNQRFRWPKECGESFSVPF